MGRGVGLSFCQCCGLVLADRELAPWASCCGWTPYPTCCLAWLLLWGEVRNSSSEWSKKLLWNHRAVWAGRDLQHHLVPTMSLKNWALVPCAWTPAIEALWTLAADLRPYWTQERVPQPYPCTSAFSSNYEQHVNPGSTRCMCCQSDWGGQGCNCLVLAPPLNNHNNWDAVPWSLHMPNSQWLQWAFLPETELQSYC